jgi:fermentation-respiration switch protein FrsA (DUF1100 family)
MTPVTSPRRALGALALLAAIALAGCSSSSKAATPTSAPATTVAGGSTSTTGAGSTTVAGSPTSPGATPVTGAGTTYAVSSRTVTWVDTGRPTKGDPSRHIAAATSRTLPVLILYPAAGTPGAKPAATPDAPAAAGTFPIVIFSHGVTASGPAYAPFLAAWAAAGYVVAAPTYPMSSGVGAWADLTDYTNQPADVSFVLDNMIKLATTSGDTLAGHLATTEVAVAGHSLGAMTSLGFLNTCCGDPRVKAIVAISGTLATFPNGGWTNPPPTPLLMIHGTADKTVPYKGGSATTFAKLTTVPRALLTFIGAGHTDPVLGRLGPTTDRTAIAFLDLELRHDPTAWNQLPAYLATQTGVHLAVAGGLPKP